MIVVEVHVAENLRQVTCRIQDVVALPHRIRVSIHLKADPAPFTLLPRKSPAKGALGLVAWFGNDDVGLRPIGRC